MSKGQSKAGQVLIDSLEQAVSKAKETKAKVKSLCQLSFGYNQVNPNKGVDFAKQAFRLAERLKWPEGKSMALNSMGLSYQNLSDYKLGLESYKESYLISKKLNDMQEMANTLGKIGAVYSSLGDYPEALKIYFQSLTINEELKNEYEVANELGKVAHIYLKQKKLHKSLEYNFKALKTCEYLKDSSSIASYYGEIGQIYIDLGQLEKAKLYLDKVLQIEKGIGDGEVIASSLINIGTIFRKQGFYTKALDFYNKALHLNESIGHQTQIAHSFAEIGETYFKIGSADSAGDIGVGEKKVSVQKAMYYLKKAVQLSRETGSLQELQLDSKLLSEVEEKFGNYQEALSDFKTHIFLKDSEHSAQNTFKLQDLELKRDLKVREKDLTIVKSELEIARLQNLNEREEQILYILSIIFLIGAIGFIWRRFFKRAKKHKETMEYISQMQSHDIRGPLASILGLTQLFNYDEPEDPINKELIEKVQISAVKLDAVVRTIIFKASDN